MNRIAVVEPQCRGLQHAPFNAALLYTTRLAFPGARLTFAAEPAHGTAVRELLGERAEGVEFCSPFQPVASGLVAGMRLARQTAAWAGGSDLLVLASTTPPLTAALGWLGSGRLPVISVFHACVAELEFPIITQILRNPLCMHTVARLPVARHACHVVLGASILQNLHRMGLCREGWVSIDHPILDVQPAPLPSGPLRLGLLAGFERSDQNLEQVLERVCARTGASWVRIGRDAPDAPPLDAAEYRRRLLSCHYAVWWAEPNGYRLRASATFLDAISAGRPLVFRGNEFIDACHVSRGRIGIRVADPAELEPTLTRIAEAGPGPEVHRLSVSAAATAASFACEQVAPAWREVAGRALGEKSRSPTGGPAA